MSHTIFLLCLVAHYTIGNQLIYIKISIIYIFPILGTPVVLLQESGIFNGNSYLIRRDVDLGRNVKEFTICAWISLNFLRGENNYWLSIGNQNNEQLLTGTFENGPTGPRIRMKKYHTRIKDEVSILLKRFDFQNFHHYCFLFTNQAQFPYPGGYVNMTNKAYVDGNLVNEEMKTIIKSNFEELPRFVDVMIGQKYSKSKRFLIQEESFSGRFADVTIFKEALTVETIQSLAKCDTVISRNIVLDWFVSSYDLNGDVTIEDLPKSKLCEKSNLAEIALFNHGSNHDYLKFICKKLGGQLPTFGRNQTEKMSIYNNYKSVFLSSVNNLTCFVSEDMNNEGRHSNVNLATSISVVDNPQKDGELYFWTGIIEDSNEIFINEYTKGTSINHEDTISEYFLYF